MLPIIAYIARITFIIVTTVIFVVALITFLRLRKKKTLLLTVGFGLLFAHGLLSIPELLVPSYNVQFTDSWHLLLDAVALLFILFGALKD